MENPLQSAFLARFSLLPMELAHGGVGNHCITRSTSPPGVPQSCEPACAEGHDVLEMETVLLKTAMCTEGHDVLEMKAMLFNTASSFESIPARLRL